MSNRRVLAYPPFVRLWLAGTVSWLGTFSFGLALQLLLIETLSADQAAMGFVRSAQWVPALAVGLLAGVLTDRMRRRPVLIAADTVTALATGAIGALALTGLLTVPVLAALVALVGALTYELFGHLTGAVTDVDAWFDRAVSVAAEGVGLQVPLHVPCVP